VFGAEDAPGAVRRRAAEVSTRVVLGAEEYLRTHLDRPIYTEELCKVLAVSPAALVEAFQRTLGTSPHRYLKLRRLNMVRAVLLCHEPSRLLVKSVALAHGFWHLGQFAHDYREHFGEAPSDTLARGNRGVMPDATEEDVGIEHGHAGEYVVHRAGQTR
jgi:AraC family ethanolamine operon transcriptional activator